MVTASYDIASWDAVLVQLTSRAEALASALDTFTPTVFLDAIKAPKDQIVYGRRGTGKTHLFRALAEECAANFGDTRTLVLRGDCSRILPEIYGTERLATVTAVAVFTELMRQLAAEAQDLIANRIDPGRFERMFGIGEARKLTAATNVASELSDLLSTGEVRYLPIGSASQVSKSLSMAASEVSAGGSFSLDPRQFAVQVKAAALSSRTSRDTAMNTVTINGQPHIPFSELARLLFSLAALVNADRLIIVIDEWSSVDYEAQPYLAQLLKLTRQNLYASSPIKAEFKLGCIPTRTRLSIRLESSPVPIGLEEGDDIFADADLDRGVLFQEGDDAIKVFLQDVLRRHVGARLSWVRDMDPVQFAQFLFKHVFYSEGVFDELCWASAGVPRDFVDFIAKSASQKLQRGTSRIGYKDVRDAVEPVFRAKIKDVPRVSLEVSTAVFTEVVYPNRSYAEFLLSPSTAEKPEVAVLWSERIWHRAYRQYVDESTGRTYDRYRVDFGMYVNLVRAKGDDVLWSKGLDMAILTQSALSAAPAIIVVPAAILVVITSLLRPGRTDEQRPIASRRAVEPSVLIADQAVEAVIRQATPTRARPE